MKKTLLAALLMATPTFANALTVEVDMDLTEIIGSSDALVGLPGVGALATFTLQAPDAVGDLRAADLSSQTERVEITAPGVSKFFDITLWEIPLDDVDASFTYVDPSFAGLDDPFDPSSFYLFRQVDLNSGAISEGWGFESDFTDPDGNSFGSFVEIGTTIGVIDSETIADVINSSNVSEGGYSVEYPTANGQVAISFDIVSVTATQDAVVPQVPIPLGGVLLLSGIAGLCGLRRRTATV